MSISIRMVLICECILPNEKRMTAIWLQSTNKSLVISIFQGFFCIERRSAFNRLRLQSAITCIPTENTHIQSFPIDCSHWLNHWNCRLWVRIKFLLRLLNTLPNEINELILKWADPFSIILFLFHSFKVLFNRWISYLHTEV